MHSATRPIRQAASSVLHEEHVSVGVIVVAHNIDREIIVANLGDLADDERVQVLDLADGIPSPAGPMNLGLESASARYVSLLGSDDELAAGALDAWVRLADDEQASAVIARIDRDIQGPDPLPPTRPGRTRRLDPVRDRLAYRCAPLGLVSRRDFGTLRFTPGLFSGEDLEFTARLWFRGTRIAYARTVRGYIGHEDATDRITNAIRPLAQDFAFLDAIEQSDWYPSLSRSQRRAFGVKNLRLHVFDAVLARLQSEEGLGAHREGLLAIVAQIERMSPGATALLSRPDRAVIDALHETNPDPDRVLELLGARWQGGWANRLTRNPFLALHSQAPYRTLRAMVT